MEDNTITTTDDGQLESPKSNIQHIYYEIGGDLLSKPNALCEILQVEGLESCAIFCNSPSDADLVDAVLRKNGIRSKKLIGHIPDRVTAATLRECVAGELQALVLTDISAREMKSEDLPLIINYSIHNDPEVYLHRMGSDHGKLKKMISLVSPMDFSNFHYLKKIVDFEFSKAELPAAAEINAAKIKNLEEQAIKAAHLSDPQIQQMVSQILERQEKEQIVALLVHNTFALLPALNGGGNRTEAGADEEPRGTFRREGRDRYQERDRYDRRPPRHSREGNGDREFNNNDENFDEDNYPREERRERTPVKKDLRFYLGHGSQDNFSEEKFIEIIGKLSNISPESIQRFSLREHYAFVDLPEEAAELAYDALKETEWNGKPLFIKKATVIARPKEGEREEAEDQGEEKRTRIEE